MDFSECQLLSRCVKCNGTEMAVITNEEAKKQLNWEADFEYNKIEEFVQCSKCKQIYWEGSTSRKAKKRFEILSNNKT